MNITNCINEYIEKEIISYNEQKKEQLNSTLNIINEINKFRDKKVPDTFWKKLHKLSVSGGFITNKNRKIIYSFILDKLIQKNTLKTNKGKNNINKYKADIKKDCNRTKCLLNFLGKYKIPENCVNIYIKNLEDFIINTLQYDENFNYYQGYNYLCLCFMIIFGDDTYYMYCFSEIFLGYILYNKYINDDILYIIDDCCFFLNEKISKFIEGMSEPKDKYKPHHYALPWILALFSRNNNLLDEMRLLDYFITSNISHLYFLCANIIINECNSLFELNKEIDYSTFNSHLSGYIIKPDNICGLIKQNEMINQRIFDDILKKYENYNFYPYLSNKIYSINIFEDYSSNMKIFSKKIFKDYSIKYLMFFKSLIFLFFSFIIKKLFEYN